MSLKKRAGCYQNAEQPFIIILNIVFEQINSFNRLAVIHSNKLCYNLAKSLSIHALNQVSHDLYFSSDFKWNSFIKCATWPRYMVLQKKGLPPPPVKTMVPCLAKAHVLSEWTSGHRTGLSLRDIFQSEIQNRHVDTKNCPFVSLSGSCTKHR